MAFVTLAKGLDIPRYLDTGEHSRDVEVRRWTLVVQDQAHMSMSNTRRKMVLSSLFHEGLELFLGVEGGRSQDRHCYRASPNHLCPRRLRACHDRPACLRCWRYDIAGDVSPTPSQGDGSHTDVGGGYAVPDGGYSA